MITRRTITADDLIRIAPDGRRFELVRGELLVMSPSGFEHGAIVAHMTIVIGSFVRDQGLGTIVGAETGFMLSRNPDTVRAPDLAFVAAHRVPAAADRKAYPFLAPDLVVEVLSPNDKAGDVRRKLDDYLAAGVRLIWVVDPVRRAIEVHRPGLDTVVCEWGDRVVGHDILPGFACSVSELFPGEDGK